MGKVSLNVNSFQNAPTNFNWDFESPDVHIWCVSLILPPADQQPSFNLLSSEEKTRSARYRFRRDRERFIVSRASLRVLLGRYLNQDPQSVEFTEGEHGKPALAETHLESGLQFNVSHSHELALLAFARYQAIGIDLEHVREMKDMQQLIRRFFSTREQKQFQTLSSLQFREAFFNVWTRKEALLKAVGTGLSISLGDFDVTIAAGEPAKLLESRCENLKQCQWSLFHLVPQVDYVGALAMEGASQTIRCWRY